MVDVSRETFEEWNEEMSRVHDPDLYHTASPLPVRLLEARRVRVLLDMLDSKPHHTVLEVGCGASNVLARVTGRRVGVDMSRFLLAKSQRRLGKDASLTRANAEQLPFADQSFDRVYCTEVLEHVLDPVGALREMARVLKPTGHAVVSVPNEGLINRVKDTALAVPGVRWMIERAGYDMPDHMEDEWHLHEYDRDLLREHVAGCFHPAAFAGVPSSAFALRWVAKLMPIP